MRLGVVLPPVDALATIDSLATEAALAEELGISTVWVHSAPEQEMGLIAAAIAARTSVVRIAACTRVGGHPLEIAESTVVADNCSNGRMILALEAELDAADLLAETVDVILAALAPRPFRHRGSRWSIPSNLPENDQLEERLIVTPPAVQPELPLWLVGPAAATIARARGLVHVAGAGEGAERAHQLWQETESAVGLAARRLRRPALRLLDARPDGSFDEDALVGALLAERREWELDTVLLSLPASLAAQARQMAIRRIASRVAPRVLMDSLPTGLEDHWQEVLAR